MSFTVELSNHPQRPRFLIKLKGIQTKFYAKDSAEIAHAVDHFYRGDDTDPRHWGAGVPECPLCRTKKTKEVRTPSPLF